MNDMGINECGNCTFCECEINDFPCDSCIHGGTTEHFDPINKGENPEEINHPKRYAGGKYECIDVMTDVFGVDAVKSFCKLNAFKYLWREQNKNGMQDLKKCAWYLDKLIELSENSDENV